MSVGGGGGGGGGANNSASSRSNINFIVSLTVNTNTLRDVCRNRSNAN